MLIDTHCHINMMVKKNFDVPLSSYEIQTAQTIIQEAATHDVTTIINVGTSLIESRNCVALAQQYASCYATVGIHPNDCTAEWKNDFKEIKEMAVSQQHSEKKDEPKKTDRKIVGIGECGIDLHYPDSNLKRQQDAFKAHIDLALENDLALVIHSRDAYDETLRLLEQFKNDIKRATVHCFSYDRPFAEIVTSWGFFIGIDAPITYPKNNELRAVVTEFFEHIVLETDAPFLPPQQLRGKENHPLHIKTIANYIANLLGVSYHEVAQKTTQNAKKLFGLEQIIR